MSKGGGSIAEWLANLLTDPLPWVQFPAYRNFSEGKILNVAEVNQQRYFEWLEKVDQTHLLLVPVLCP